MANLKPIKKWAKKFDECTECHRNDRPHCAHGLCDNCYEKWAYYNLPGRKEHIKKKTIEWQKKHPKRVAEISKKATRAWRERFHARDPEGLRKKDREHWVKYFAKNREKINAKRREKRRLCKKK